MKPLTIVIPLKQGNDPKITLLSLSDQTFQDFDVVIVQDEQGNANWARNRGFEKVKTEFVLFCDDDIQWFQNGVEPLVTALRLNPDKAYAYGAYSMEGRIVGHQTFDAELLKCRNFISTMSVLRTADFPGFDESIKRLQDWDVWLTLLEQGKAGVFCGRLVFKTAKRPGITYNSISYEEAEAVVKRKHNLI